jgi:hypothetical protein
MLHATPDSPRHLWPSLCGTCTNATARVRVGARVRASRISHPAPEATVAQVPQHARLNTAVTSASAWRRVAPTCVCLTSRVHLHVFPRAYACARASRCEGVGALAPPCRSGIARRVHCAVSHTAFCSWPAVVCHRKRACVRAMIKEASRPQDDGDENDDQDGDGEDPAPTAQAVAAPHARTHIRSTRKVTDTTRRWCTRTRHRYLADPTQST